MQSVKPVTIEELENANGFKFTRKGDGAEVVYIKEDGKMVSRDYKETFFTIAEFVEVFNECLEHVTDTHYCTIID